MTFETWGVFSVTDHLEPRAFVADVLLYDRLVIPVPGDAEERERWDSLGRDPGALDTKLAILDRPGRRKRQESVVVRLNWTKEFRRELDRRYPVERRLARIESARSAQSNLDRDIDYGILADLGERSDSYPFREFVSLQNAPVTADIVAAYTSFEAIRADLHPRRPRLPSRAARESDRLARAICWEFFVPSDTKKSDEDLLEEAVALASDNRFRRARESFHSWRREVTTRGLSPARARQDLEQRLGRYQEENARLRGQLIRRNAFILAAGGTALASSLGALMGAAAAEPLEVATSTLALIPIGMDLWKPKADVSQASEVAMFHDARKQFGWKA